MSEALHIGRLRVPLDLRKHRMRPTDAACDAIPSRNRIDASVHLDRRAIGSLQMQDFARLVGSRDLEPEALDDLTGKTHLLGI